MYLNNLMKTGKYNKFASMMTRFYFVSLIFQECIGITEKNTTHEFEKITSIRAFMHKWSSAHAISHLPRQGLYFIYVLMVL